MHTATGKKRKRGPIHFAVQSSVVIPEYHVPLKCADSFKGAYLRFKESQDSQASDADRALIRRRIGSLQAWPPISDWRGQIFTIEQPINDLVSEASRAQRGNKSAKTFLCRVGGIPATVFFKGPFADPIAWETQAYVDSVKPAFGLHPIGVLCVVSGANQRDLLMRDLNDGEYSADSEGIVDQSTVKAVRANQVFSRQGVLPNQEGMMRVLLFRAAWGISDSNGNNILYREDLGHWFSVDENVMFSAKAASRLAGFSLTAQNHKATRPIKTWLKKFDFRTVLADWLRVDVAPPPIGSLVQFRTNMRFMLDNYDQLDH